MFVCLNMACLNMLNNEQQSYCSAMGPRISFSNDFVDTKQAIKQEINSYTEAPVSSDFEFSVPMYPMNNAADELFCKGKLVPLKENSNKVVLTLRDELLVDDDDDDEFALNVPKIPKTSGWWKLDKLGMKRNHHIGAKKPENGGLERIDEAKKSVFLNEMFTNMTGEFLNF